MIFYDTYKKIREKEKIRYLKNLQNAIIFSHDRIKKITNFDLTYGQKKSIDDFFIKNYGKRIDYTCHKTYTLYSGKFDEKYIPESIYIPEIEYFLNYFSRSYNETIEDKNIIQLIASGINIKTPIKLFSNVEGLITDSRGNIVSEEKMINTLLEMKEFFIKPTKDTGGGNGCMWIKCSSIGVDQNSGIDILNIIRRMNNNYLIQECIKCHPSISKIYSRSVNTFRILTYRWKNSIKISPVVMRIGTGGMLVDNASLGGVFVAINDEGEIVSNALNKYGDKYETHPDTNVYFKGYKIEYFNKVIEAALNIHSSLPQIGIANWDFTIDEDGDAVLIEGNIGFGGIWVFQMAHGCSAFGDDTAEILQWVRRIKRAKIRDRGQYMYGK